ncbi:MAG TPA: transporter substrate-binding domain-containing protein [Methanocorpusculum sp.]|nr:transporter substrate-binding domain-containing protein [Methanocorpusculum sp.]
MRRIIRKAIILCTALLLTAVLLSAGCVTEPVSETKPVLLIAVNTEIGAYNYYDENGNLVGIDIDIAKAICDEIGMQPAFEDLPFKSILPAVRSGDIDMGIAGITITAERAQTVDFSHPYTTTWQSFIYNPEKGVNLASLKDIAGKTIGVKSGTTGESMVKTSYGSIAKKIVSYEQIEDAVRELNSGEIDCIVFDNEMTKTILSENPHFKALDDKSATEDYGIAVQKGNTGLLDKINAAVDKFLADGTIDAINKKYLN